MKRLASLCGVFAAVCCLAACSAPSAEYEAKAREAYTLEKKELGDTKIPALVLSKNGAEGAKRPAVILVHGGAIMEAMTTPGLPYKEEWFRPVYEETPYRLADKGMLVVAIDAAWAESRLTPEVRAQVPSNPAIAVWTFYIAAVDDITRTIDYLCTRDDVDPERIAAAGKSGGALTCLMAACREPRLEAVVSWKGGADFVEMGRIRGHGPHYEAAFKERPEFRETLAQADPINCAEHIFPIALAMINNRKDPEMPDHGAEALYAKLLPLYAQRPERLMLKFFETHKPTHNDQEKAFEAGCEWLEKHLLAEPR